MSIWKNKTTDQTDISSSTKKKSHATVVDLQGLIQLRYQSTHLSLGSQRKAYSSLSGSYSSPFKGRGLNFDEVRPYQPGDDIRNIDWNVTARTDKVHTKVFKEERERPVFIIVDLSSSMYFGTRHCLKSVAAAKAAALFAWAGADNSNRIGGLVFNDTSHIEMRPKGGHRGVLQFLKMLSDFHNNAMDNKGALKSAPEALNTELLFARIQKIIHPGSIVLLASDFHQFNDRLFVSCSKGIYEIIGKKGYLFYNREADEITSVLRSKKNPSYIFLGYNDGFSAMLLYPRTRKFTHDGGIKLRGRTIWAGCQH